MFRENDYLRKLLQKEKEQYQLDMKNLKKQNQKLKVEKQNISLLYQ